LGNSGLGKKNKAKKVLLEVFIKNNFFILVKPLNEIRKQSFQTPSFRQFEVKFQAKILAK